MRRIFWVAVGLGLALMAQPTMATRSVVAARSSPRGPAAISALPLRAVLRSHGKVVARGSGRFFGPTRYRLAVRGHGVLPNGRYSIAVAAGALRYRKTVLVQDP